MDLLASLAGFFNRFSCTGVASWCNFSIRAISTGWNIRPLCSASQFSVQQYLRNKHTVKLMEATTNLVIRPCDGCVMTVNGRQIPQPPWIFPDDQASVIAYHDWLLRHARTEAVELQEYCILH
jgi:hypothetical protein